MTRESRDIYLDNSPSYRVTVSPEGYRQILEIIRATAVCESCKQHYGEPERINVVGLLCLQCFLRKYSGFTFVGPLDHALQGKQENDYNPPNAERPTYLFLDREGYAHLTDADGRGNNTEARTSVAVTLKYWGFPRPEEGQRNGQTVKISDYGWSVYGNVRTDEIVMLQHGSTWHNDELLFVAMRNGQAIQINRRKPMHRQLLADAKAELEATRSTPDGNYLIDGTYQSWIHEGDIYRLVARRIGEAMLTTNHAAADDEQPEPAPTEEEADEHQNQNQEGRS